MPGVNLTGLPQSSDIVLGRGALYFAALDSSTQKPLGFRHLGNATAFSLNVESETLEHFSSRTGIRSVDREIVLSQKCGVSLTLDQIDFQNIGLFLSGAHATGQSNAARTASVTDRLITADAYKGFSYDLVNSSGARLYDLASTGLTVKSHVSTLGSAATLVEGTDYTVDRKWGTIHLLSTSSTLANGDSLWFSYTSAGTEQLLDTVDLMTETKISGFLRFKLINAANSDKQMLLDLHSVALKADGEMPLISDEFTTMTLTGSAERNEIGFPTSPVGRFYYHADA